MKTQDFQENKNKYFIKNANNYFGRRKHINSKYRFLSHIIKYQLTIYYVHITISFFLIVGDNKLTNNYCCYTRYMYIIYLFKTKFILFRYRYYLLRNTNIFYKYLIIFRCYKQ